MLRDNNTKRYLAAASIASELYRARTIAEELSITSKNARALAVRAGSSAAGFNEITNFIEGLAKMTIETANRVNNQAVELTRSASVLSRTQDFLKRLQRSLQHQHCSDNNQLKQIIEQTNHQLDDISERSEQLSAHLALELDETGRDLRSTKIVTVVARVESARADKNVQVALNAVADRVANAGDRIKRHIDKALKTLNEELR
ncbi:MAG: hypothetical protein V2I33_09880 [Kangiellaceae bacterium]|jgi:hypothetical protein|nr:hypothetical protein [Kangiellaceae bacterium]